VHARKQANPSAQRSKANIEISQLMASRQLALRRNDQQTVHQLEAEIIKLGGDPSTGQFVDDPSSQGSTGNAADEKEDYDTRIQRINENNKKRTKEAMAAAHLASIQRRKAEEAIVKAKQ
jgi:RNA polymerase-associated protein RTF1